MGLPILQLLVVRYITVCCTYSKSAARTPLQVVRCECAGPPLRQRPSAHLLRRFHPYQINHIWLPRVGGPIRRRGQPFLYCANKAIMWMLIRNSPRLFWSNLYRLFKPERNEGPLRPSKSSSAWSEVWMRAYPATLTPTPMAREQGLGRAELARRLRWPLPQVNHACRAGLDPPFDYGGQDPPYAG
jgi:hypothetical protein